MDDLGHLRHRNDVPGGAESEHHAAAHPDIRSGVCEDGRIGCCDGLHVPVIGPEGPTLKC